MTAGVTDDTGQELFVSAQDGLRLHVREYGRRGASGLPVVCLAGLTRTVADFETLAPSLARGGVGRRVLAIDSRGRGRSEHDRNAANYNLQVELTDVVTVLIARAVGPAVFIGSSRGGLLTMLLGVAHPTAIAGVVLHDVGPVLELTGLARMKSYVGKLPQPRSYEEGAEILRRLFSGQFPKLTEEQWLGAAKRAWHTKPAGRRTASMLTPTHDVRLAQIMADLDVERAVPPLWNEFDALARVPMLVIRGANSDLLSAETVAAMRVRRAALKADMQVIEVPDQGHVPLLEGDLVGRIASFVESCDQAPGKGPSDSPFTAATADTTAPSPA
jgi:pimeloyl-ACP methyl ester carboxylesterase